MKSGLNVLLFSLFVIFFGCSNSIEEAKEFAAAKKYDDAIEKLTSIPGTDKEWSEAQKLMKEYRSLKSIEEAKRLASTKKYGEAIKLLTTVDQSGKEWSEAEILMKEYVAYAIELARQGDIRQAFTFLRSVNNSALREVVSDTKAIIGKAVIRGSWRQISGGMGDLRVIQFSDGEFAVVDNFTNSSYGGSYTINRITDGPALLSLTAQCVVHTSYQNINMPIYIDIMDANHINVNAGWVPTSNGQYARLN